MRKIKDFKNFKSIYEDSDIHIHSLDSLRPMSLYIHKVGDKLEKLSDVDYKNFLDELTDNFGDDVANIIERRISADKLHYYQNSKPSLTGGIDIKNFIENFDEIKMFIDNKLSL